MSRSSFYCAIIVVVCKLFTASLVEAEDARIAVPVTELKDGAVQECGVWMLVPGEIVNVSPLEMAERGSTADHVISDVVKAIVDGNEDLFSGHFRGTDNHKNIFFKIMVKQVGVAPKLNVYVRVMTPYGQVYILEGKDPTMPLVFPLVKDGDVWKVSMARAGELITQVVAFGVQTRRVIAADDSSLDSLQSIPVVAPSMNQSGDDVNVVVKARIHQLPLRQEGADGATDEGLRITSSINHYHSALIAMGGWKRGSIYRGTLSGWAGACGGVDRACRETEPARSLVPAVPGAARTGRSY